MTAEEFADKLVMAIGDRALPGGGGGTAAVLVNMYSRARERKKLADQDKKELVLQAERFVSSFGQLATGYERLQTAAMEALVSAVFISAHFDGSPEKWRQLTEPARKARKQERLDDIIHDAADEYWKHSPQFRGRYDATARKIYREVMTRRELIADLPHPWNKQAPSRNVNEKRIEAIGTRLRRRARRGAAND